MQYYMSISEVQDRISAIISHLTVIQYNSTSQSNSKIKTSLRRMMDPNLLNNEKVVEEILSSFLNAIILAGQLGIDIESKINEYLIQLERESLFAM